MITCAHNVVHLTPEELDEDGNEIKQATRREYTDLVAYQARKGTETYLEKFEIISATAHPKYDGSPSSGYDIALCFFKKPPLGGQNST